MKPSKIDIGDLVLVLPDPLPKPAPFTRRDATLTRGSITGITIEREDRRTGSFGIVVERSGCARSLTFRDGENESWWDTSRLKLIRKFKWPK